MTAPGRRRAVVAAENAGSLGQAVRDLRIAQGLTQAEVAGPELTKALVSQIELGRTRPSEETLELIAHRLGTSADALLGSLPQPSSMQPGRRVEESVVIRGAEALIAVGRLDEAETQLQACRGELAKPALAAAVARLLSDIQLRRGDTAAALRLAGEALAAADQADSGSEQVEAVNAFGRAHFHAGRYPAALQYFDAAIVRAERLEQPDPRLMARLHSNRGNTWWRLGAAANADSDFNASLRWSEDAEDLRQLGLAHMGLGEMARDGGDNATAMHHIELAIGMFERLEERLLVAQNLHNLGETTAAAGDLSSARALHERALAAARAIKDDRTAGYALERLAALEAVDGDGELALRRAEEAVALAETSGDDHLLSLSLATLGDALQGWRRGRGARQAYARAREVAQRAGPYSLRSLLVREGDFERRRGDLGASAAAFEAAARLTGTTPR